MLQIDDHKKGSRFSKPTAFAFCNRASARVHYSFVLLLFTLVLSAVYAGTLHSPWILDDQQNILDNNPLHLTELSFSTLKATLFAKPQSPGTLYRPLACASFAINWYFGQDNPAGYHAINLSIHILTTFFLYFLIIEILRLVLKPDEFSQAGLAIALCASLFWALNPVQTQAITYIVQRMASLAALFSVVGMFFFLKARTAASTAPRIIFGLGSVTAFVFALASKENAILVPASLLLLEFIIFGGLSCTQRLKKATLFLLLLLFTTLLVFAILYLLLPLLSNYESRSFSLTDRILTQPRILIFYLTQIFLPIASRLSLEHDVILPSSVFVPWTTIPSFILCVALIVFAILTRKWNPLLALSILFYFLNHIVESSIIPLELIFEHRNYLPSIFLFLPISAWALNRFHRAETKSSFRITITLCIFVIILFFGMNTTLRNRAWSSTLVLMQDAHAKAPNSSRAATNLAKEHFLQGNYEKALTLSEQAYLLWHPSKHHAEAISLNAQGVVHHRRGDDEKASRLFQQSLNFMPKYGDARKNLIISLCAQRKYREAYKIFFDENGKLIYDDKFLLSTVQCHLNLPADALITLRTVAIEDRLTVDRMTGIGKALSMIGHYQHAEFFLRQTANFSPLAALIRIENFLHAHEIENAEIACRQMLSRFKASDIFSRLNEEKTTDYPLSLNRIKPFVIDQLNKNYLVLPANVPN